MKINWKLTTKLWERWKSFTSHKQEPMMFKILLVWWQKEINKINKNYSTFSKAKDFSWGKSLKNSKSSSKKTRMITKKKKSWKTSSPHFFRSDWSTSRISPILSRNSLNWGLTLQNWQNFTRNSSKSDRLRNKKLLGWGCWNFSIKSHNSDNIFLNKLRRKSSV
jgi:hypothetical protein